MTDRPASFTAGVTRYGASVAYPNQACAVLRAAAQRAGLSLQSTSEVDLVAAVIAADAWTLVTRSTSFASPATYGAAATRVLSAVLHRAAGQSQDHLGASSSENCSSDPAVAHAADAYAAWAQQHLGDHASTALLRAASDLCVAGPTTAFASVAEVLRIAADNLIAAEVPTDV
jgi:hypothetical protein